MGHPRDDDREHEYVLKTVEKLDYSKFDLLLLGGDLTWNTSELVSTMDYCDTIFNLGDPDTHLAIGNHDMDNINRLLSYTKKERFYSFSRNNLTFIVLDTELSTPDISGTQLDLIKAVADTIKHSDYLVLIHHRILWMADNPDLAHLRDSVASSSRNLSSSNFLNEVYPELQKVKNKGIPVYCIAGDRTDINIEYSIEDSIQFIASGMVGTFPDEDNYAVVLTHYTEEPLLEYEFVPLSEMDTVAESSTQATNHFYKSTLGFHMYPNPSPGKIIIQFEPVNEAMIAEIYTLQGVKIMELGIPENRNIITVDMTSLENGLYQVCIRNDHVSRTEKLFLFNTHR
jgi:hypothetical protein